MAPAPAALPGAGVQTPHSGVRIWQCGSRQDLQDLQDRSGESVHPV